ncbi:MAG: hypothetical protein WBQ36_05030, partial [Desulfobaccales bacterium]
HPLAAGVQAYAQKRLTRFRGISPENFCIFLQELEFRYNYRNNCKSFTISPLISPSLWQIFYNEPKLFYKIPKIG